MLRDSGFLSSSICIEQSRLTPAFELFVEVFDPSISRPIITLFRLRSISRPSFEGKALKRARIILGLPSFAAIWKALLPFASVLLMREGFARTSK